MMDRSEVSWAPEVMDPADTIITATTIPLNRNNQTTAAATATTTTKSSSQNAPNTNESEKQSMDPPLLLNGLEEHRERMSSPPPSPQRQRQQQQQQQKVQAQAQAQSQSQSHVEPEQPQGNGHSITMVSNGGKLTEDTTTTEMSQGPEKEEEEEDDNNNNDDSSNNNNNNNDNNENDSTGSYDPRRGPFRNNKRSSSLDLRKLPTSILMTADMSFGMLSDVDAFDVGGIREDEHIDGTGQDDNNDENQKKKNRNCSSSWFVLGLCLSSDWKLKTQLMLSFGTVNVITIFLVCMGYVLVTYLVSENVKFINREAFETELVPTIQAKTVRYLAEALEQQFMPIDLIDILEEATQDRLQGYPNSILLVPSTNNNSTTPTTTTTTTTDSNSTTSFTTTTTTTPQVPFKDIITGQNIYPIIGDPMFLDWQIPQDVTENNYKEHLQESRWKGFYQNQPAVSTTSAVLVMQGACNPNITDPKSPYYWPNCTDANNDISTGGAIHPVPTAGPLFRALNDLIPLVKAIYETKEEIRDMGLYLSSMGAGATFDFPAFPYSTQVNYTSVGCDWMKTTNPVNPSLGPIGRPDEFERCHPDGESVSVREYNPLERGWCRDQALNPQKIFLDSYVDAWNPGHWLLSIGRAIYDRQTDIFVGCSYVGISLYLVEQKLKDSLLTENSTLSLIRFDPYGTVLASTAADTTSGTTDSDVFYIDKLQVGLTLESYQTLYDMIPYDQPWIPDEVRDKYSNFTVLEHGFLVGVSPMPRIPDTYDRHYKPEFFVVMSTATKDVYGAVKELNDDMDSHVKEVFWFSFIVGLVGLAGSMIMIILMANALTAPLRYINDSADDILAQFGDTESNEDGKEKETKVGKDDIEKEGGNKNNNPNTSPGNNVVPKPEHPVFTAVGGCTPKTELSDVLDEFNKLVANFSGSLMSKSEKGRRVEVRNPFGLQEEFADLYASRKERGFPYSLDLMADPDENDDYFGPGDTTDGIFTNQFGFIHIGSNIEESSKRNGLSCASNSHHTSIDKGEKEKGDRRGFSSRLFLWTVALIVTPLILTTVTVSAVVLHTVRSGFDDSIQDAKDFFIGVNVDALSVHAALRAEVVAGLTAVPVRDLYLTTRYFGWLFFGGVNRADSFTELASGTQACNTYSRNNITECPFVEENYVCDCAWNDARGNCQRFPNGSRHLQRISWSVEADTTLPDGDRNSTSYPKVAYSPESTVWWDDLETVPGWEKGSAAGGHDTLYDRLRVSSAMPIIPVLYNYDVQKKNYIGHHIGFEADGLMMTFTGCAGHGNALNSQWRSSEANGGPKLRPELCPEGKHGYDPRCRGWYDTGRKLAMEKNSSLYISAPYKFAILESFGQSATSPLIDPRTGEHVAQVLYDFYSNSVFEALDENVTLLSEAGFRILVAAQGDVEEDAVIGPNFTIGKGAQEIGNVVLPLDIPCEKNGETCTDRRDRFRDIVASMKDGEMGNDIFTRTNPDNGETETIHISYAPVKTKSIRPLDTSNFARGIDVDENVIYSLALCETETGLIASFTLIEKDMIEQINWAIGGIVVGILLAFSFIIYFSYLVTKSITTPMLYLLDLISCINRSDFEGDPPKIEQAMGSREIKNVSDTVLILYKIVRAANDFFFAGELGMAYVVLADALGLFKKLGNQKAVGVASNNLANTFFAMYREMKFLGLTKHCGLTKHQIIAKAMAHFHESITLGEKAYDDFVEGEGWTPNCLDFMQHLSNRYFNRALFLLTVKDDHEKSNELEILGMRDLEIARDMDLEIAEYGKDIGFNRENRAHKMFYANLIRARGHNVLLEMGYPNAYMENKGYPEEWELNKRLDENFQMLREENEREASELFEDVNVLGRLQEIEAEIMKYNMLTGNLDMAAKIAIRMMHEDAYIFADSMSTAVAVLLAYSDTMGWDDVTCMRVKRDLSSYNNELDRELETLDEETRASTLGSTLDSFSENVSRRISTRSEGSTTLGKPSMINWVKHLSSGGFVMMEDF